MLYSSFPWPYPQKTEVLPPAPTGSFTLSATIIQLYLVDLTTEFFNEVNDGEVMLKLGFWEPRRVRLQVVGERKQGDRHDTSG